MRSVRRAWLPLLTAALTSVLISCASWRGSPSATSAIPDCPLPSMAAAMDYGRLVHDPDYPAFNLWFSSILEYCWHERYEARE